MYVIGFIITILGVLKVLTIAWLGYYNNVLLLDDKDILFIVLADGIFEIFAGCYLMTL